MSSTTNKTKDQKGPREEKTENMQTHFFFTAVPVDLLEDAEPTSRLELVKFVPGFHIPKDYKENLAKQKDAKYQELVDEWLNEKDPERKKQKRQVLKEYWTVRRKELGFLDEDDIKRLKKEQRKKEEEEKRQREIERQKQIQMTEEKIAKGIPAKHILYCDYPDAEFREEIKASDIKASYEDEYDSYQDWLHDFITDILINLDFEQFVGDYFTEDEVPACGHFWFGEVRTEVFGNGGLPLNKNIKIYLDSVREDGTVIDTKEIDIRDYVNLESEKETLMECGLWDATNTYIETSLNKFVEETGWHVALQKETKVIEDVTQWPAPKKNGTWIDKDGEELYPCLWYGYDEDGMLCEEEDRVWNIDNGLEFWFSDDPERYVVEYDYDGHAGCYGGDFPDIEAIRKRCPILLEENDTEESIGEKVQAYCKKQYKKAHKSNKNK